MILVFAILNFRQINSTQLISSAIFVTDVALHTTVHPPAKF